MKKNKNSLGGLEKEVFSFFGISKKEIFRYKIYAFNLFVLTFFHALINKKVVEFASTMISVAITIVGGVFTYIYWKTNRDREDKKFRFEEYKYKKEVLDKIGIVFKDFNSKYLSLKGSSLNENDDSIDKVHLEMLSCQRELENINHAINSLFKEEIFKLYEKFTSELASFTKEWVSDLKNNYDDDFWNRWEKEFFVMSKSYMDFTRESFKSIKQVEQKSN